MRTRSCSLAACDRTDGGCNSGSRRPRGN
jgi:hypothetical protein